MHTLRGRGSQPGVYPVLALSLALSCVLGLSALRAGRAFEAPSVPRAMASAEATINRRELRASLTYLAGDDLAGRGVGSDGNAAAVSYIASLLERYGIAPTTHQGFLQPVELLSPSLGETNQLELLAGPNAERRSWNVGDEFFPVRQSPSTDLSAPLAYAGSGLVDAASGRDDFAGIDVTGRIVVVLERRIQSQAERENARRNRRLPPATLREDEPDSVESKAKAAAARGARALLVASRDRRLRSFDSNWNGGTSIREAAYHLADSRLPLPTVRIGAEIAAALLDLDRDGSPVRSVNALYDNPSAHLDVSDRQVRLQVAIDNRSVAAPNVLGLIEGRDPEHRHEMVVIGAHLDHDGVDSQGRIYNGADDDGSGMVAVLELAEAFATAARNGQAPRRSILLAFWNAEEKGLLGSTYFTHHIVPEAHRLRADLNLDMVGRHEHVPSRDDPRFRGLPVRSELDTRRWLHIVGYSYSPDLASLMKEEAPRLGLTLRAEYDANPIDLLRRSDHWPFLAAGVPALFMTTGLHPDYHTPQDDVGAIDFEKLERIARLTFRVAWRLAEADAAPRFTAATVEP